MKQRPCGLYFAGNSLAEYILPAALVGIACISGVSMMAGGVESLLGVLRQDTENQVANAKALASTPLTIEEPAGSASQTLTSSGQAASPPASMTPSAAMQGDPLSSTLQELKHELDVAGANGTTSLLASQMEQQVNQWVADGTIMPQEANALMDMANAGHRMAQAEKLLEDAYIQGTNSVTFEGKTYALKDFMNSQPWLMFGLSFQKVMGASAYQKPAVKQEINNLVLKMGAVDTSLQDSIASLTGSAGSTPQARSEQLRLANAANFDTHAGEIASELSTDIGNSTASTSNHNSSGQICTADGKNRDTGSQCVQ